MKIGILTFHWAHNYGAVLQAYALYTYLERQGHDVEIINYVPNWCQEAKSYTFPRTPGLLIDNIDRYWKSRVFRAFQKKHLRISKHRYHYGETISGYDVVIVGSDQVFNPDIIAQDGKLDDTYLLANVAPGTRKIAYAASFGNSSLRPQYASQFRKLLSDFDDIGIREESGCGIVETLGLSATTVPDPTILLGDFSSLLPSEHHSIYYVLGYLFQQKQSSLDMLCFIASSIGAQIMTRVNLRQRIRGLRGVHHLSPPKWIQSISDSQFVVTDSFHATVFAILAHRSFILLAIDAWGDDWSERGRSLLNRLGILERFLLNPSCETAKRVLDIPICWDEIESRIEKWRKEGAHFINQCLDFPFACNKL